MADSRTQTINDYAAYLWTQNIGPEGDSWAALDANERAAYIDNECIEETVDWFAGRPSPHVDHERLLARSIVKIAEASGVKREALPDVMTGPMILDLAEQTADHVLNLCARFGDDDGEIDRGGSGV